MEGEQKLQTPGAETSACSKGWKTALFGVSALGTVGHLEQSETESGDLVRPSGPCTVTGLSGRQPHFLTHSREQLGVRDAHP